MAATQVSAAAPQKFYGWKNAALLFYVQFAGSGFVYYAYSVIFPAMVIAMDWNRGDASLAQGINLVFFGLTYPLTAWLIGKKGVRFTLTVGYCFILAILAMIIFLVSEIWHWTIIWGLLMGIGLSLTGPICAQTTVIHWFNIRRATVLGIVTTGAALGGFLAQPVLAKVMEHFGSWQAGWTTSSVIVVIAIVVIQFVRNHPGDVGQFVDNIDPDTSNADQDRSTAKPRTFRTERDWTIKQIFRHPVVYMLLLINIAYLGTSTFLLAHGVLHLTDIGISNLQAVSLIGTVILGSGIGRIPIGWLGDRFEMRWLVASMMGLMFMGFMGFWLVQNIWILYLATLIYGACFGGFFVVLPALNSNFFGEKVFPLINAVFAPLILPVVGIAPAGAGYIFEEYGNYDLAFLIGAILLGLALVTAIFLKPPHHPESKAAA